MTSRLGRGDLDTRFEVLRALGRGSFGEVFEVQDRRTGARFACKLLSSPVAQRDREARELEVSLSIRHAHVVRCYAGELTPEGGYLLLELCEGSLEPILHAPGSLPQAWELLAQTAEGLAELHRHGLVHRDLKPSNILVREGAAKVADLGLITGRDLATMTQEGLVLGTPAYMAPEQAQGKKVTPAADVFALGVLLYQCLEGRLPYPDVHPMAIVTRVARADLAPLVRAVAAVGAEGQSLVESLLAADPAQRPTDLDRVARRLRAVAPRGPTTGSQAYPASSATQRIPAAGGARLGQGSRLGSTPVAPLARAGSTAVRTRRGRRWWLPPLVLALAGVVAGTLLSRAPAPPPPPAASPFPPDYLAWLHGELTDATDKVVSADGTIRSVTAGPPTTGEHELLSWDPHQWAECLAALPQIQRFYTWVGEGGRPEDLTPSLRAGLLEIDERYAGRRFRRPFHPYLYTPVVPPDAALRARLAAQRTKLLASETPWGWTALRAGIDYLDAHAEADAEIRGALQAADPSAFQELLRVHSFAFHLPRFGPDADNIIPLMVTVWSNPRQRPLMARWNQPIRDRLERFLYAAMRAAAEDPLEPWLQPMIELLSGRRLPWFGSLATLPLGVVVGRIPETPPGHLLASYYLREQGIARQVVSGNSLPVYQERLDHLLAFMQRQAQLPWTFARSSVVSALLHDTRILGRDDAFDRVLLEELPLQELHDPVHYMGSIDIVSREASHRAAPLPWTKAEVDALLERFQVLLRDVEEPGRRTLLEAAAARLSGLRTRPPSTP